MEEEFEAPIPEDDFDTRLAEVERRVQNLVEVCGAVADDTLRMCFVLDEMHRAGMLPAMPWNVATLMVELHHAQQAEKNGDTDISGEPLADRIQSLKREILSLREEYQKSLTGETVNETQPTG
jgi:hypothetical protein